MNQLSRKSSALTGSCEFMPLNSTALVHAACRTDLVSFVHKCFNMLAPNARFLMNWHICAMAHHLEQVWRGKIKRLIITVPPRSLKSITCSVAFPGLLFWATIQPNV